MPHLLMITLRRVSTLVALLLCTIAIAQEAGDGLETHPHYFHLRQGVTLYIANPDGRALDLRLDLKDINMYCKGPQTALLKLYGPDGEVLHDEELADDGITSGGYDQAWAGWDHELWARGAIREVGAEPLFRSDSFSEPAKLDKIAGTVRDLHVAAGTPGVYRLQIVGNDDHYAKIALTPGIRFGVLGHPDFIAGHGSQFRESYLYVHEQPFYSRARNRLDIWMIEHGYPRTRSMTVSHDGQPLTFANTLVPKTPAGEPNTTTRLTPAQALGQYSTSLADIPAGAVLKLELVGTGDVLLRIGGLQPILCPDPDTARYIAGGMRRMADGPLVSEPWQARLWDSIAGLQAADLRLDLPADGWMQTTPEELAKITAFNLRGVARNPGDVTAAIEKAQRILSKQKAFDLYAFMQAYTLTSAEINGLGMYYLYPFTGNSLYRHETLRNLATVALVNQWLRYRGGEVIYRPHELNVAYMQGFHWDYWHPVWVWKESFQPATLAAFQEGLTAIGQRMYYANALELVISNGRACIPLNLYHAYLVTENELLRDLSLGYFQRMYTAADGPHSGWSTAGYFREHFGPDGGYTTYPLYQLGRLYQLSKDPDVLACLDANARWVLYNALPNQGRLTGATSFNARIAVSAIEHIWGDGYLFFAQDSAAAAMLYHRGAFRGQRDLADPAMEPGKPMPTAKPTLLLTHLTRDILPDAPLPADRREERFVDLGGAGEFFAVQRGDYYALIYSGKRAPFWMDHALDGSNGHNGGGLMALYVSTPDAAKNAPLLLGRSVKEYGFPIESWDEFTAPVATGQVDDGRFFNTGISRSQVDADAAGWTITTTGECSTAPVNYTRSYTFQANKIDARVTLRNSDLYEDNFQYRAHFRKPHRSIRFAHELIPYRLAKDVRVTCYAADGSELGELTDTPTDGVVSVRIENAVSWMIVTFDTPRTVRRSHEPHDHARHPARSLIVHIADDIKAGQQVELTYSITSGRLDPQD